MILPLRYCRYKTTGMKTGMLSAFSFNIYSTEKVACPIFPSPFLPKSIPYLIAIFEKNLYNTPMEKRHCRRITVHLKGERISGNEKCGVFIENISESGIQILTTPLNEHLKYHDGTEIDLRFHLLTGDTLNLHCKVKWSHLKIPPNGMTDSIGMEIIDPPKQYIEYVRTLH